MEREKPEMYDEGESARGTICSRMTDRVETRNRNRPTRKTLRRLDRSFKSGVSIFSQEYSHLSCRRL